MFLRVSLFCLGALSTLGCVGTTGGDVIDFDAAVAGPKGASGELAFNTETNGTWWHVVLTKAELRIGAVYLDDSLPVSGAQNTACYLPGTYVAEVTTGIDADLLSGTPQRFSKRGHGTTLDVLAAQVWLTGGDVNDVDVDPTANPILAVEGTASAGNDVRPFKGAITISSNRNDTSGAFPGANPICKARIVSPIPTSLALEPSGGLLVRVEPRMFFTNVDFSLLTNTAAPSDPPLYEFSDTPSDIDPSSPAYYSQPSLNLFANLTSAGIVGGPNVYSFEWDPSL
jgi:hypothetical protein